MKSVLAAPSGLILVDGKHVVRRYGVKHRTEALHCLLGHEIAKRASLIEGVDIPVCSCGLAVYVVSMHGGFQLRADLTAAEAEEIRGKAWRLGDVFRYLGAELRERVA